MVTAYIAISLTHVMHCDHPCAVFMPLLGNRKYEHETDMWNYWGDVKQAISQKLVKIVMVEKCAY